MTTARNRAIDRIRRDRTLAAKLRLLDVPEAVEDEMDETTIPDERLELVFTCCHPALALDAQVALTLRLLCGLSTRDVARSFLVSEPTMAARITRAKKKIAIARIPYRVPAAEDLPARTHASQGEQRSLALALRLAGHRLVTGRIGSAPILLLDDVFSELDPVRAEALLAHLPDGQALITTSGPLPAAAQPARVITVREGRLSP